MKAGKADANQSLVVHPSPLVQADLFGGRCFEERAADTKIDTVVIHSCCVPQCLRDADTSLLKGRSGDQLAIELGHEWRATNDSKFENAAVMALLKGRFGDAGLEPYSLESIKSMFEFYGVSAHYVVDRSGEIFELVPPALKAFHAGKSRLPIDGREQVNGFSIGIELLADETSGYTEAQMVQLSVLIKQLQHRYPIVNIVGHSDISPERKTDPWQFDWERLRLLLGQKQP